MAPVGCLVPGFETGTSPWCNGRWGFAPHCPLVVLSFTTPSLGSAPFQRGSREAGSLPQRGKGTEDSSRGGQHVSWIEGLGQKDRNGGLDDRGRRSV